jgi:broad specificity phosphatase PhoE
MYVPLDSRRQPIPVMPPTTLYLLRHGATEANMVDPPRLQGRRSDPPLAALGVLQAQAARDRLAQVPLEACWCSPLRRAVQTATIVADPHGLTPQPLETLTECDLGDWEGRTWDEVRQADAERYARFRAEPARNPHPGGESLEAVHARVARSVEEVLDAHPGKNLLVVSHHVVLRVYLAGLLGLGPGRARELALANGAFAVVVRDGGPTQVRTVAETNHLGHAGFP